MLIIWMFTFVKKLRIINLVTFARAEGGGRKEGGSDSAGPDTFLSSKKECESGTL